MFAPAFLSRSSVVRAQSSSADKNNTRPGSSRSSLRGSCPPLETSAAMYSANSDLPRPGSPTSRVIPYRIMYGYHKNSMASGSVTWRTEDGDLVVFVSPATGDQSLQFTQRQRRLTRRVVEGPHGFKEQPVIVQPQTERARG